MLLWRTRRFSHRTSRFRRPNSIPIQAHHSGNSRKHPRPQNFSRRFCHNFRNTVRKPYPVRFNFRARAPAKLFRAGRNWNTRLIRKRKRAKGCFPPHSRRQIAGSSDSVAGNVMPILRPKRRINPTSISGIPICKANSKATPRSSIRTSSSTLPRKIFFNSKRANCRHRAA